MTIKQFTEKYYLCGIGQGGVVENYRVGKYDEERESFYFSNGIYSPNELYKEPRGGNAIYIVKAISLQEIDDAGLLDKYKQV